MRLGRRPSVRIRVFPAHTRESFSRVRAVLILWVLLLILAIGFTAAIRRVESVIQTVSARHATNLATRIIHEAVDAQILKHNYTYTDFVTVQTDEAGRVQSLAVNPATVNRLKAEVALEVEKRVSAIHETRVQVPYAAFLSDDASVGFGPRLTLELAPVGYCIVDFENTFLAEGINQTKHQVDIVVKANFAMMMAYAGSGVTVQTRVPVAQTVIVGNVPESYFQIQK